MHRTPTQKSHGLLLLWFLPFNLFGLGGPTRSYTPASIALRVSRSRKPSHHIKAQCLCKENCNHKHLNVTIRRGAFLYWWHSKGDLRGVETGEQFCNEMVRYVDTQEIMIEIQEIL